MAQAPVLAQAPAVQLPTGGDGRAVGAAAGNVPDTLGLQGLDQTRLITVPEGRRQGQGERSKAGEK